MMKNYFGGKLVKHLEYTITGALLLTTAMVGVAVSSIRVNADDNDTTVSTASVTVQASCSMTATIDTAHTANIPNGIYSGTSLYPNGIGKTNIATFCNDNSGYAIYAIGFTGDNYTGADHTKLIGQATSEKIATGTATSGSTSNWAMKLVKETDSTKSYNPANLTITNGYDDYSAIPDTYTKVANYTSTTDQTLGSVLSTTYVAYISGTQVADTYVGKVKYTLVHPNTEIPLHPETTETGKICYYPNGSAVVGTMGCQDVASSIDLLASNFSRTGYGFAGWNTEFDYSGTFYGPNETISLNTADYSGTNPGLSLYAIWVKSVGSLQDSSKVTQLCGTGGTGGSLRTAPIDGTANLSSVSALTDQRDNNTYAIARLADGKCWMIENLRLDNTAELTTTNTNNPLNDGTNVTLKHNYTDTDTHNTLSSTSAVAYNADTAPDGWCTINSAACDDQSRLRTDNTANRATGNPNVNTGSMYSYGNYYNWYSATAGNGTYSKSSGETAGDLCPSGWKLPYGNSTGNGNTSGGFYYLNYKINNDTNARDSNASKNLRAYPNNYLYSGYVSGGSLGYRGSYGDYWSSTASSSYGAYNLALGSSDVNPGASGNGKYYGWSVRCLASS